MIGPVMIDLEGTSLTAEERQLLQHPLVGGVIYFARNYQSPGQIQALTQSIRALRQELLIAVDQEGGRVQRFQQGFTRLPAMQQFLPLYRKNRQAALDFVQDAGWLMASELLVVGIDFSFSPVLDLDDNHCEVIANRSFSPDPQEVVALAGAWMRGMHQAGMATVGKHFPGHGSVRADSHLELPVDNREFTDIASRDLVPFIELQSQLDGIMPAHILFPRIDSKQPAGFSRYWLQTLLRGDLGYKGVIFSDDLAMAGAANVGSFKDRALSALKAGCDMILLCNHRQGTLEVLDGSLNDIILSDTLRVKATRRLSAMHNRESIENRQLVNSDRWQLTRQLLETLTG